MNTINTNNTTTLNEEIEKKGFVRGNEPPHKSLIAERQIHNKQMAEAEAAYNDLLSENVAMQGKLSQMEEVVRQTSATVKLMKAQLGNNTQYIEGQQPYTSQIQSSNFIYSDVPERNDSGRLVTKMTVDSIQEMAKKAKKENDGKYVYWF